MKPAFWKRRRNRSRMPSCSWPDVCVGLDDRAHDYLRQTLLYAAVCVLKRATVTSRSCSSSIPDNAGKSTRIRSCFRDGVSGTLVSERAAGDADVVSRAFVRRTGPSTPPMHRGDNSKRHLRACSQLLTEEDTAGHPVPCLLGIWPGRRPDLDMPASSLWTLYERLRARERRCRRSRLASAQSPGLPQKKILTK